MAMIGRRAFLGTSAAAVAGAVVAGRASEPVRPVRRPGGGLTPEPPGPEFHRLRFEGGQPMPGEAVHVRQAGVQMVPVAGGKYKVWTKRIGTGPTKVLVLHGGPGFSHDYLECLSDFLPPAGYELYFYDQLGCGNSDHPEDDSLWTVARYRQEVEEVRAGLGLTDYVLYGQSWGGMLAQEVAITSPKHLKAVVISNMTASIPSYVKFINERRKELPAATQAILSKFEAEGKFDAPEYQKALMEEVYTRFICRLDPWPEPVLRAFARANEHIYNLMQGPSEFTVTGTFKEWDRWADLPKIPVPTLLIVGRYDTMSAEDIQRMGKLIPRSRVTVCEKGSHLSLYDDQDAYFASLLGFLRDVDHGNSPKAAGK